MTKWQMIYLCLLPPQVRRHIHFIKITALLQQNHDNVHNQKSNIFCIWKCQSMSNKELLMSSVQLFSIDCWPTDSMLVSANADFRLWNYSTGHQAIPERISKLSKYSWFCETAAIQDQRTWSQMRLMKSFYLDWRAEPLGKVHLSRTAACLLSSWKRLKQRCWTIEWASLQWQQLLTKGDWQTLFS